MSVKVLQTIRTNFSGYFCFAMLLLVALSSACSKGVHSSIRTDIVGNILIYVDQADYVASDDNNGTEFLPLKSISAALHIASEYNTKGLPVKILVSPGTYRESLLIDQNNSNTDASLALEAIKPGKSVITGSDVWKSWTLHEQGFYSREWPYKWGLVEQLWAPDANMTEIVRRREMVFYNGTPLRQVLTLEELGSGDFYISERNERIYIDGGDNANTSMIEVAKRSPVLLVNKRNNISISGFVFQHDNSFPDRGAVRINEANNIVLLDNRIQLNNWTGLQVSLSSNITTIRNIMTRNGGSGWNMWRATDISSKNDVVSYNNWRGYSGGFLGWAVAGAKHLHVHNASFENFTATYNHSAGFWLDTDNQNIKIKDSLFCQNLRYGVFIESNQGPIEMSHSQIVNNRNRGIFSSTSENIRLVDNIIANNEYEQIRLFGLDEIQFDTWFTNTRINTRTRNWTLDGNTISSSQGQLLFSSRKWDDFFQSLIADNNIWYNATGNSTHKIGGEVYSSEQWKLFTGQDVNSSWNIPPSYFSGFSECRV